MVIGNLLGCVGRCHAVLSIEESTFAADFDRRTVLHVAVDTVHVGDRCTCPSIDGRWPADGSDASAVCIDPISFRSHSRWITAESFHYAKREELDV